MLLNFKLARNFSQVEFMLEVADADNPVDQIRDAYALLMAIDDLAPAPQNGAGNAPKTAKPARNEPMATKRQLDYIAGLDPYFDRTVERLTMREARERINKLKRDIDDLEYPD